MYSKHSWQVKRIMTSWFKFYSESPHIRLQLAKKFTEIALNKTLVQIINFAYSWFSAPCQWLKCNHIISLRKFHISIRKKLEWFQMLKSLYPNVRRKDFKFWLLQLRIYFKLRCRKKELCSSFFLTLFRRVIEGFLHLFSPEIICFNSLYLRIFFFKFSSPSNSLRGSWLRAD